MTKKKIPEFNIIRAVAAVCIFMYHAYYGMACDYGPLNPIIANASFYMTIFFILSGYVLFHNYHSISFDDRKELGIFYKKRILSIYPLYFFVWLVFYLWRWNQTTALDDLIAFPLQWLILQNTLIYGYLMNSGLWFFSCIMICYLVFPLLNMVFEHISISEAKYICVVLMIIIVSLPFVSYGYNVELYQNAFGRLF
jgi:peptidoglycan/LPS O-acetylase OafA/YrhL